MELLCKAFFFFLWVSWSLAQKDGRFAVVYRIRRQDDRRKRETRKADGLKFKESRNGASQHIQGVNERMERGKPLGSYRKNQQQPPSKKKFACFSFYK